MERPAVRTSYNRKGAGDVYAFRTVRTLALRARVLSLRPGTLDLKVALDVDRPAGQP